MYIYDTQEQIYKTPNGKTRMIQYEHILHD